MSKNDVIKAIQNELMLLNQQIDLKIIRGLSYQREAHRHKMLTSKLKHFSPVSSYGWLAKIGQMITSFFF